MFLYFYIGDIRKFYMFKESIQFGGKGRLPRRKTVCEKLREGRHT